MHSFALARLQLDNVYARSPGSPGVLNDILSNLPTNLDEFYNKAIAMIGGDVDVLRLLSWVVVPPKLVSAQALETWEEIHPMQRQGPLTSQELRHAIAIKPGIQSLGDLQTYMPNLNTLVEASGDLCTLDQKTATVSFAHPTVQEFLMQRKGTLFPSFEIERCRACIAYLSLDEFGEGACNTHDAWTARLQNYPFLEYAGRHWCEIQGLTATSETVNTSIQSDLVRLLLDPKLATSLQQVINYSHSGAIGVDLTRTNTTGLLIATQFNLLEVMEELCKTGADVNASADSGQRALDVAVMATPEFVRLLLKYDALVVGDADQDAHALAASQLPYRSLPGGELIVQMLHEARERQNRHGDRLRGKLLREQGRPAIVRPLHYKYLPPDPEGRNRDGGEGQSVSPYHGRQILSFAPSEPVTTRARPTTPPKLIVPTLQRENSWSDLTQAADLTQARPTVQLTEDQKERLRLSLRRGGSGGSRTTNS